MQEHTKAGEALENIFHIESDRILVGIIRRMLDILLSSLAATDLTGSGPGTLQLTVGPGVIFEQSRAALVREITVPHILPHSPKGILQ